MESPRDVDLQYSLAYEELRRLATTVLRGERDATLSPTTLVHEAWLKLAASRWLELNSELHFKRVAARAMRQVLVDAARRRKTMKRGRSSARITFDEEMEMPVSTEEEALLELDNALAELARCHPRQAEMVESRYFAGLTVPETASLMGISEATVQRDWRVARAWLAAELGHGD